MLRKVAVALLAATMFTAPVLAQGTGGANANPPATSQPAKGAAAKTTTAKPVAGTQTPAVKTIKKVKKAKTHRHHAKAAKRVGHAKPAGHAKTTKFLKSNKQTRHVAAIKRPQAPRADAKPMVRSN